MHKQKNWINKETVYFYGEYDQSGKLCTKVIRGYKSFWFQESSLKYIDGTLKQLGFSLKGAWDGSKDRLGNKKMLPIVINAYAGIYFIPLKSPSKPDCVWLSLLHINHSKALNRYQTMVYLSYGHTIIVDMKESNFRRRVNRAIDLRRMVSKNMDIPQTFYFEPKPHVKVYVSRFRNKQDNQSLD